MIHEKNPGQESVHTDSSDDEAIIDLTEEITVESEDDFGKVALSENLTDEAPQGIENDEALKIDDDDDILALDETNEIDLPEDQVIDNAEDLPAEDHFFASTKNASPGAENDETGEMAEEIHLSASDDGDIAILDDPLDEADEAISAGDDNQVAEAQGDEDVFDLEKEVEQEYEWDDDEDELLDLDDERIEDDQDFVDLMLGASNEPDQRDDNEEMTEYLDLETEDKDHVNVLDADRGQETETNTLTEKETPEFIENNDLSDLESISNFDFEGDEDDLAVAKPEADSRDETIAVAAEQSIGSDRDRDQIDLVDQAEFGMEDDDILLDLDGLPEGDEEVLAVEAEENLTFENDDDLLDLKENADLETDDEVITLDGFDGLDADDSEEIVEISEFDQHFPTDGDALLKQSGILDPSDANEEDFLELIDIEDDHLSDDEKMAEFSNSPEASDDDKINQFINDELEEDQPEPSAPESIFSDDLEDILHGNQDTESIIDDSTNMKPGPDDEVLAVAREASDVDSEPASEAEIQLLEDENYDFVHRSVSQQVDGLDTFLSENAADEPQAAPVPVDQAAEEGTGPDNSQIIRGLDGLQSMPAEQIDAAIERIINEKFSDKIEGIIYKVIEKAVSKEIDRIKGALTGSKTIDDYEV